MHMDTPIIVIIITLYYAKRRQNYKCSTFVKTVKKKNLSRAKLWTHLMQLQHITIVTCDVGYLCANFSLPKASLFSS